MAKKKYTRPQAVKVGNQLIEEGLVTHVADASKPFIDGYFFYHFAVCLPTAGPAAPGTHPHIARSETEEEERVVAERAASDGKRHCSYDGGAGLWFECQAAHGLPSHLPGLLCR